MASYTVAKGHTLTHDQKVYGPGETIDLTEEHARKVTSALEDGPDPFEEEADGDLAAALDSIRRRPDNPDRPPDVEGEEQFKVSKKGALAAPAAKSGDAKGEKASTEKGDGKKSEK